MDGWTTIFATYCKSLPGCLNKDTPKLSCAEARFHPECLNDRLVREMLKISLSSLVLPDPRISLCLTFSCGSMLKTEFMFHYFQQISMT